MGSVDDKPARTRRSLHSVSAVKGAYGSKLAVLGGAIGLLCSSVVATAAEPPPRIAARRISPDSIAIDGELGDRGWRQLPAKGNFVQRAPYDGRQPTEPTQIYVGYDDEALYVLVRAFDSQPDRIRGLLTRRDETSSSDWIHLWLDTHDDNRTAYRFSVNPAGVLQDARVSNDGQDDINWNGVWHVETGRNAQGWFAEYRIPFSQIRYDPNHPQWGIQVGRKLARNNEDSYFSPFSIGSSRLVSHFGTLAALDELPDPWRFEAIPYASAALEVEDNEISGDWSLGGDLRFGLGPALSLELTINPDFGQVEADPSVLNLTAYETFFAEKRPFFLEGAEIFRFPIGFGDGDIGNDTLFYSRRIGRAPTLDLGLEQHQIRDYPKHTTIIEATKLTGKSNDGWSLGLLQALTNRQSADVTIDGQEQSRLVEPMANALVARVSKELRQGETKVGGIFTHMGRQVQQEGYDNFVDYALSAGVDVEQRHGDIGIIGKLYGSHLHGSPTAITDIKHSGVHYFQRPDAYHLDDEETDTTLSGWGLSLLGGKLSGSTWRGAWGGVIRSPGLNTNELGYLRRADEQMGFIWLQYRQDDPGSFYQKYQVNLNGWTRKTFGPEITGAGGNVNGTLIFKDYSATWGGIARHGSALDVVALRGGPALKVPGWSKIWWGVASDDRKDWMFEAWGDGIVNDQATDWQLSGTIRQKFRPLPQVQLMAALSWIHSIQGRHFVADDDPRGIIVGDLERDTVSLTLRGSWAITRDLTLQLYMMPYLSAGLYRSFYAVTDPRAPSFDDRFTEVDYSGSGRFIFKQIRSNLVVRWEYLPASTAFLVWSHEQTLDNEDHGVLSLTRDTGELFTAPANDVLMLKLSYWLSVF